MPYLSFHQAEATGRLGSDSMGKPADTKTVETAHEQTNSPAQLTPLLVDIEGLAVLLARSVPSLHRDDAAGRLPTALWIGGSKRWRYSEIAAWVEAGCPSRAEWTVRKGNHR